MKIPRVSAFSDRSPKRSNRSVSTASPFSGTAKDVTGSATSDDHSYLPNYKDDLATVREWVEENGGDPGKAFARILLVNNGLSALRVIQGIRTLSCEITGGRAPFLLQVVALASDADWVGNGADEAKKRPIYLKQPGIEVVRLSGRRPRDTYQDQKKVLKIARERRCDAIAVGWGHLAENIEFAEKVRDLGLIFIGPPPDAMRLMGDKIMSKLLLAALGVPMLPWSGDLGIRPEAKEDLSRINDILRKKADGGWVSEGSWGELFRRSYASTGVSDTHVARRIAGRIGYPIVIKATAGGGGRGIRFVNDPKDLNKAFKAARAEADLAFNNDVIFIEKAAGSGTRHVEEQILADHYGGVTALGERECSIQRHNQKLIEEAGGAIPISDRTRARIRKAAVTAAKGVGYTNAGTVEFLVDGDGEPYFMEMNTRLQVEHIATEALSPGLDLLAEQLRTAMGLPLEEELKGGVGRRADAHSISVRVLAENPDAGFSPQSGTVKSLDLPPSGPNSPRFYYSVGPEGAVHSFADSQIGHAVAKGRSREEARLSMIAFLEHLRFEGLLTTRAFTLDILRDEEFVDGRKIHTNWLQERLKRAAERGDDIENGELGLMAMAIMDHRRKMADKKRRFFDTLKSGQKIKPTLMVNTSFTRVGFNGEIYGVHVREVGEELHDVTMDGNTISVGFWENKATGSDLLKFNGEVYRVFRTDEAAESHVEVSGRTMTFVTDLDPTTFRAPLAGRITEIMVQGGQRVEEGETLFTLEAMKMITSLVSPRSGVVRKICVEVGDNVDGETVLMRFEEAVGEGPGETEVSEGRGADGTGEGEVEREGRRRARDDEGEGQVRGEEIKNPDRSEELATDDMTGAERQRERGETFEKRNGTRGGGPQDPGRSSGRLKFRDDVGDYWHTTRRVSDDPGALRFRDMSPENALREVRSAFTNLMGGYSLSDKLVGVILERCLGLKKEIKDEVWIELVTQDLEMFLRHERYFKGGRTLLEGLEVVEEGDDPYVIARSHANLPSKKKIVLALLDSLTEHDLRRAREGIQALTELGYNDQYREVVAKAEELLGILARTGEPAKDLDVMMADMLKAEESGDAKRKNRVLKEVMEAPESLMGKLVNYLLAGKSGLKKLAGKLIILRAYRRHTGLRVDYEKDEEGKRTYVWRYDDGTSEEQRLGVVSLKHRDETFGRALMRLVERLKRERPDGKVRPKDVVELLIGRPSREKTGGDLPRYLADEITEVLGSVSLARVTLVIRDEKETYPGTMTFRLDERAGRYAEDVLYRNLHPSLGDILSIKQLEPLKDHISKIPSSDMNVHLYHYRKPSPSGRYGDRESRIYVRTMIRNSKIVMGEDGPSYPAAEEAFRASLHQLRIAYASTEARTHDNQIYLRFVRPVDLSWDNTRRIVKNMDRYLGDLSDVDLTRTVIHGYVNSRLSSKGPLEMFIIVDNPTGLMLEVKPYAVVPHEFEDGVVRKGLVRYEELLERVRIPGYVPEEEKWKRMSDLYREMDLLERKRKKRRRKGKVYAYDRIALLKKEVERVWSEVEEPPEDFCDVRELVLDRDNGELCEVERGPGNNDLSILAWRVTFRTPEAPEGREIVLVSGDMTVRGGSVAVREDRLYTAASRLARKKKLPFVYFAEGSGARIGLDKLVSHRLHYDEESNELYLSEEDHALLKPLVRSERRDVAGEERHVVTSIVGGLPGVKADRDGNYLYMTEEDHKANEHKVAAHLKLIGRKESTGKDAGKGADEERKVGEERKADEVWKVGEEATGEEDRGGAADQVERRWIIDRVKESCPEINQENLSGSAMTARASSLAFRQVPTMAVVTDTCTGIISYNVRLLKRVIQTAESEIILTGYRALNALYGGEEIFTSNRELGGPHVMGPNGISHRIVEDEREACRYLVEWLRTLPLPGGERLRMITNDPVDRDVRDRLIGVGGVISPPPPDAERPKPYDVLKVAKVVLDKDSVMPELEEWGKSVRVGRAAVGGIPVGFIGVETDTVTRHVPADPADRESRAEEKLQFGQVWYPDSSFKTAQWIEFMRRERKPLVILPNWRGFAGGKSELFEEILKFGAMIVDELASFDLPVVLYVPPYAEIRGGAWVVIDTQINPENITFLADEHATGSILEPSGMVTVPLVSREIMKDMRNKDPELCRLYRARRRHSGKLDRIRSIDEKIEEREEEIYPSYLRKWQQIFRRHNTAERMKEVGVAHKVVSTGEARKEIYLALKEGLEG